MRPVIRRALAASLALAALSAAPAGAAEWASHAPMRPLPEPSARPRGEGPAFFADAQRGDDANPGTEAAPWRTANASLARLKPGDTLYLRAGIYSENVLLTARGTREEPVTVRSFPGELAVIDGGYREFLEEPAAAWEPAPGGAPGEFRSTRPYADIGGAEEGVRVLGNFADSLLPLHGYRNLQDLRATSCYWQVESNASSASGIYCGPGLIFDPADQRIHIRLAHTALDGWGAKNYAGEQDPRRLALIVAGRPAAAFAIADSAWVRVQDLVLRGSRVPTLTIADSADLELDGVTAYGGSSAADVKRTARLRIRGCAFRGIAGPWSTRSTMKYRGIESRIFSASGWSGEPGNEDFDIADSEFTDSCDGIFVGSVRNMDFHRNLLANCSDDGFFVTATTGPDGATWGGNLRFFQNVFARCLTTFAFGTGHGAQRELSPGIRQTGAGLYIYRNVFDLREPVHYGHPATPEAARAYAPAGRTCGDHGGPIWEPMWIYHNTVITREDAFRNYYGAGLGGHLQQTNVPRRVFNNIFVQLKGIPGIVFPSAAMDFDAGGNLFWSPADGPGYTNDFAAALRKAAEQAARTAPPRPPEKIEAPPAPGEGAVPGTPGARAAGDAADVEALLAEAPPPAAPTLPAWGARDLLADPRFAAFAADWAAAGDWRLTEGSPAVDAGVPLPAGWPDPLRGSDTGGPDIGALPLGAEPMRVGVGGRVR